MISRAVVGDEDDEVGEVICEELVVVGEVTCDDIEVVGGSGEMVDIDSLGGSTMGIDVVNASDVVGEDKDSEVVADSDANNGKNNGGKLDVVSTTLSSVDDA